MSRPQGHIDTCQCYGCLDPSVATIATLRARVAELEAERDRDFERGYDQGVCEALSTMSAEDAAYCRKKFPNWDKAWKEAVGRDRYLAATPKGPDDTANPYEPDAKNRCNDERRRESDGNMFDACNRSLGHKGPHQRCSYSGVVIRSWEDATPKEPR